MSTDLDFCTWIEASYPAIRPNQSDSQGSDHNVSGSHFAEALYSDIWASTAIPTLGET